jgi:predicted site-specific integrase-resolvase
MKTTDTQLLHLITRRQLANRWSTSIGTIKRRERAGLLPVVTLGGNRARYRISDVEAYESQTTTRRAPIGQ